MRKDIIVNENESEQKFQFDLYRTDNLFEILEQRKELLSRLLKEKEQALVNAPEGSIRLSIRKKGKRRVQYYINGKDNHKEEYLKKGNDILIQSLLQKDYDLRIVQRAEEE